MINNNNFINWSSIVEEAIYRRKKEKLSQEGLADIAGLSTPTINRFESSRKRISDIQLKSIIKILKALGMYDKRRLDFVNPKPFPYHREMLLLGLNAKDADKDICCGVTFNAIKTIYELDRKKFDLSPTEKNILKAYKEYRYIIEHELRKKYISNETDNFEHNSKFLIVLYPEDLLNF